MARLLARHKFMLTVLLVCVVLAKSSGFASSLQVMVGNTSLPQQFSPILTEQGFVVPIDLASVFGAEVVRREGEYVVRFGQSEASVTPGNSVAKTQTGLERLVVPPMQVDERLFVPLRFLTDLLGLRVSWDVADNRLDLTRWAPFGVGDAIGEAPVEDVSIGLHPHGQAHDRADREQGSDSSSDTLSPGARRVSADAVATLILPFQQGRGDADPTFEPGFTRGAQQGKLAAGVFPAPFDGSFVDDGWKGGWQALQDATGLQFRRRVANGLSLYTLTADEAFTIETAHLVDPDRLVVDVKGIAGAELEPLVVETGSVRQVRATTQAGALRLIFDLTAGVGHRVERESDAEATILLLRPLGSIQVDAESSGGRITLDVPGNTPYQLTRLTAPERLVIDFVDTTLVTGPLTITPAAGPISAVRAAQFQPDIARVVLDLKTKTDVQSVPGRSVLAFEYGKHAAPIGYRVLGEREVHIGVKTDDEAGLTVTPLTGPDRLAIDVHNLKLTKVLEDAFFLSGPVYRMRVSQFDESTVRIVADLRYHVRYGVRREQDRTVVVLRQPLLSGRTVTIDAGHGGMDGGALGGKHQLVEKEINLDIARRLENLTAEVDGRVHLTRADDSFIGLWQRPKVANESESDVFVSIHNNSARSESETASGTETYVRAGERESEALGAAIQSSLVSALGTRDRGVRESPGYIVLKGSKMPAVLVEVAFLSHPEDEGLLNEAWFRQRAAEGIFNGLLKYFHPDEDLQEEELKKDQAAQVPPWHILQAAAGGSLSGASSQ